MAKVDRNRTMLLQWVSVDPLSSIRAEDQRCPIPPGLQEKGAAEGHLRGKKLEKLSFQ